MVAAQVVLILLGVIAFAVAAFGVPARVNLMAAGAAFTVAGVWLVPALAAL